MCSLTPFFDKNRDKAVYVLISFSRNLTACCFASCIAHLQADRLALPEKWNAATCIALLQALPHAPGGEESRYVLESRESRLRAAPGPNRPLGNSPTRGCDPSAGMRPRAPE